VTESVALALQNLLTPAILFFALGMLAGFARSDLSIPEAAAKTLALYLMLAIGFKGGVEAAKVGLTPAFVSAGAAGILLSFVIPVFAFMLLRGFGRLEPTNAAATAAHYGSVSVVTFVAGTEYLKAVGVDFGGYMVAVVALMETPAILSALFILGMSKGNNPGAAGAAGRQGMSGELLREVAFNGSVVLLVGAFIIGVITGEKGMARLEVFVGPLFQGALALFLLDMGLIASRRLMEAKLLTWRLVVLGLVMPLISMAFALVAARVFGVTEADAKVLAILAASASYIAVPAAMRIALPKADPGIYLTMSLGITFPFNLLVGIPLYQWATGIAYG
jgi:uncharacterized protein